MRPHFSNFSRSAASRARPRQISHVHLARVLLGHRAARRGVCREKDRPPPTTTFQIVGGRERELRKYFLTGRIRIHLRDFRQSSMLYFSARGTALTASRPSYDSDANDHGSAALHAMRVGAILASYRHVDPRRLRERSRRRRRRRTPTRGRLGPRLRHRRATDARCRPKTPWRRATRTRDYAARSTPSARPRRDVGRDGRLDGFRRSHRRTMPSSPRRAHLAGSSRVKLGVARLGIVGGVDRTRAVFMGRSDVPDVEGSLRRRRRRRPGRGGSTTSRRRRGVGPRVAGGDAGEEASARDQTVIEAASAVARTPDLRGSTRTTRGRRVRRRRRRSPGTRGRVARGRQGRGGGGESKPGSTAEAPSGRRRTPRRRSRASRWRGCRWWRGGPGRSDTAAGPRFRGGARRWRGR